MMLERTVKIETREGGLLTILSALEMLVGSDAAAPTKQRAQAMLEQLREDMKGQKNEI